MIDLVLRRLLEIGDRGQLGGLDRHDLGGVHRLLAGLGDDDRDRVAVVPDLVRRERPSGSAP